MTSFWGYVTEGVFLLILAVWWMVNISVDVIKCKHDRREYVPRIAYPWPGTNFPLETVYKLLISATGFFGQLAYAGGRFYDEEGNFKSMTQLMYMTIYALFLLHAMLELLLHWRVPIIKGTNYAVAALGFFWYAFAHLNGANDVMEEHVKYMVQIFPIYVLFPISLVLVLEYTWQSGAWISMVRTFCLATYANWCFHSAHILHSSAGFPGSEPNTSWNLMDHANVSFTSSFFGMHVCINLVAMVALYTLTALVMRMRYGLTVDNSDDLTSSYGYAKVATDDVVGPADRDSAVKLLASHSSC